MVKNAHYLAFDGSFGGLMTALVRAQNDPASVRDIPARNGELMKNFTEARVAGIFAERLSREYRAWNPERARPVRRPEPAELAAAG